MHLFSGLFLHLFRGMVIDVALNRAFFCIGSDACFLHGFRGIIVHSDAFSLVQEPFVSFIQIPSLH